MKISLVFVFLLVIFVIYASAQARPPARPPSRCAGRPGTPTCTGARNVGTRRGRRGRRFFRRCSARKMWYFDTTTRQCTTLRYLGCGGNNNRWCTKAACEQACLRPTG